MLARSKLEWKDLLLLFLPALAWWGLIHARPSVMTLHCMTYPERCTRESILFAPDRLAVHAESAAADHWSFVTQDAAGILAALGPLLWLGALALGRKLSFRRAGQLLATDWVVLLQAVVWNGVANETTRLLVQRPRPFVYTDPARLGTDPAHYTSFYSGHTSFAAVAGVSLVASLAIRRAPNILIYGASVLASVLVFLTGLFRVLSGRHFITDVIAGAIAGSLIAFGLSLLHSKKVEPTYHEF